MAGDCGEALAVDAEVVIVGAGIAGLATALALRQVGMGGVLVLERHAELRATGAALTIFPNGWMALRALGVAHKLTSRYEASGSCVRFFLVAGKLTFSICLL
jgi:2-polyprenyl-6-methoxyphenol hydroxylase-like FAD-dependent oxidoreductase